MTYTISAFPNHTNPIPSSPTYHKVILFPPASSLQFPGRHHTNDTGPLGEPRPKHTIRILEHPILQTNHHELTPLEPRLDQAPNVLRMRQIQRSINLVEDIHRSGLELQQREDEGEGDQGPGTY